MDAISIFNLDMTPDRQQSPSQSSIFTFSTNSKDNELSPTAQPTNFQNRGISSRSRSSPTYMHRYTSQVSNPLSRASQLYTASLSPSARAARRNVFLNRIKQDRESSRFENRGEQLMFMENMAEQKRWGESMRRGAEELSLELEEDVEGDAVIDEAELHALDEFLEQKYVLEMEQMAQMAQMDVLSGQQTTRIAATSSFSDDDDYDDIFMDLADPSPSSQQDVDMASG